MKWLAGLLEGEGCFYQSDKVKAVAAISVGMTDQDVVQRVAEAFGGTNVRERKRQKAGWKSCWITGIQGVSALAVMLKVYQEMGKRRKADILSLLEKWEHSNGWQYPGHRQRDLLGRWA